MMMFTGLDPAVDWRKCQVGSCVLGVKALSSRRCRFTCALLVAGERLSLWSRLPTAQ